MTFEDRPFYAEPQNVPNEETALLGASVKKRRRTPLDKTQLSIALLMQLAEPITSQSIYPYITQVCYRILANPLPLTLA
jgi:hypothetical protein